MSARYLMCPPRHFAVVYRINPWMDPVRGADPCRAMRQWRGIERAYREAGHSIVVVPPAEGLPDMVFAANSGIVVDNRVLAARFRHPERTGEEAEYLRAFLEVGFSEVAVATYVNEGEGDYLVAGPVILGGSGFRTDPRAHDEVSAFFGRPVVPLELVDPRFYHLDTALAVLGDDLVAYYPGAFSPSSVGVLAERFPDAIVATEEEALGFGLNACSDGDVVVHSATAGTLADKYRDRGFTTIAVDTSELQKAGGSVKCCTLELRVAVEAGVPC